MKILITGGLGVIGSNLSLMYLSDGHDVHILDVANQKRHVFAKNMVRKNYPYTIIIEEKLEGYQIKDLESFDLIIHCAASTNIPQSIIDPVTDFNSNVLATQNLLEQLRLTKKKIPTIIFSSVKPYQVNDLPVLADQTRYRWDDKVPGDVLSEYNNGIDESFTLSSEEPYGATKAAQSLMSQTYAIAYDLPIVVFRFSNLYAPGNPKAGHGWLTTFCIKHALDQQITIEGTGFQVRDMLNYLDIYSAINAAKDNIEKTQRQIFNIGGGYENSISVREAVYLLKEVSGKEANYKFGVGRKFEDLIFITNHFKFSNLTGWKPKVSVKEGMTQIYNWAIANKDMIKDL